MTAETTTRNDDSTELVDKKELPGSKEAYHAGVTFSADELQFMKALTKEGNMTQSGFESFCKVEDVDPDGIDIEYLEATYCIETFENGVISITGEGLWAFSMVANIKVEIKGDA